MIKNRHTSRKGPAVVSALAGIGAALGFLSQAPPAMATECYNLQNGTCGGFWAMAVCECGGPPPHFTCSDPEGTGSFSCS
jgi:hypothetical protein